MTARRQARSLWRRGLPILVAVAVAFVGQAVPASGHPEKPGLKLGHGGPGGHSHREDPHRGIEEAGFHDLDNTGFHTDIMPWVSQDGRVFAATGTWGTVLQPGQDCPSETDDPFAPHDSGVKIIEATDPENPEKVAHLGTIPGAQNNDVKVARLPTTDGPEGEVVRKDLLVHSLEPCGVEGLIHQIPGTPLIDYATTLQREAGLDQTGFQIYDVSDPENPVRRGTFNNGGLGTHNLYVFNQGDRSFVAAVYNEVDFVGLQNERLIEGYLQIVEITDPDDPTLVSQWNLHDAAEQGGPPEGDVEDEEGNVVERGLCQERGVDSDFCYNHDVWISDDGTIAYNAWWDAGLVLLNITDPATPTFLGQAQEQVQSDDPEGWLNEEGNTHSMVPMEVDGRHIVVVGDEDFTGGAPPMVAINNDPLPDGTEEDNEATSWSSTRPSGETGDFWYAGTGCTEADYAMGVGHNGSSPQGKIVFVDAFSPEPPFASCPAYTFLQKVALAEAHGAVGFVQHPHCTPFTAVPPEPDPDQCREPTSTSVSADIPALELFGSAESIALRRAVVDSGAVGEAINATLQANVAAETDPWGFMRVVDVGAWGEEVDDPSEWREVAQFKAPHVEDPSPAEGDRYTAHNPILGPDGRIYFSWYSNGVRVLELSDGGATVDEQAWFVPLPEDHEGDNDEDPRGIREANAGFWGSWPLCHPETGELLVFNSDSNRGIYVLRMLDADCAEELLPDLTLSSGDIQFTRERGRNGGLRITATVHNAGQGDAEGVEVLFELDGEQVGDLQVIGSIPAGGSGTASVVVPNRQLRNEHEVTVTADPSELIEEADEANNSATATWTRRP